MQRWLAPQMQIISAAITGALHSTTSVPLLADMGRVSSKHRARRSAALHIGYVLSVTINMIFLVSWAEIGRSHLSILHSEVVDAKGLV